MGVRDSNVPTVRNVLHLGWRRHPPTDLFERVYDAILAGGAGADLDDLRARAERFRRKVEAIVDDAERRRWSALADGIEGAVLALSARAPRRAERCLRLGLRGFIVGGREAD
jgi:hypothetical protein